MHTSQDVHSGIQGTRHVSRTPKTRILVVDKKAYCPPNSRTSLTVNGM